MSDGLNLDHDEARAIHRVVRAMHDGECPKCHNIHNAEEMRVKRSPWGWKCPLCDFAITEAEGDAALAQFATFMDRNLAVFERWREAHFPKEESY